MLFSQEKINPKSTKTPRGRNEEIYFRHLTFESLGLGGE